MPGTYSQRDIQITDDGDLVNDSNGDLLVADINRTIVQHVLLCLLTEFNDFDAYPEIGSTLESYIGENNTRETGDLIRREVIRALTSRSLFRADDLNVDIVPISSTDILIKLTIYNAIEGSVDILLKFDLNNNGIELVETE